MAPGEDISWGTRRGARDVAGAMAGVDIGALDRVLGWQADTEGRLRDAVFFEPMRGTLFADSGVTEEALRCVFTRTTADYNYIQWSRTNTRFSIVIAGQETVRASGNDLLVMGYLRVGVITAPANTSDGDLTASRLMVGTNATFPTNVDSYMNFTSSGLFRVDTDSGGAVQRFQVGASVVQVGVDGSAPQFVLAARDGTNEGGEMQFNGAGANTDWVLDNNTGEMRLFVGSTVYHHWATTFFRSAGYGRYGSVAQPANTTAGDLTATRLFINNDSLFAFWQNSGNPRWDLDTGDFLEYSRTNNDLVLTKGSAAPAQLRFTIDARAQSGASAVIYFIAQGAAFAGPSWFRQGATDTRLKWGLETPNDAGQDPDLVFYRHTGGVGAEVRAEVMRFLNTGAEVIIGADGSAPVLRLEAADGTNEGGEMVFSGASTNNDWRIDNNTGELRWFVGGTVYMNLSTTFLRVAGYGRFGSVAQPTNTTGGDLTCVRLNVGNVAFLGGAASLARVNGISDFDARRTRVFNAGSITVPTSTWTTITCDSERFDNDTLHSTAANTGRLTATVAGTYLIIGNISFDASATGTRIARIFLNGATEIALVSVPAVATGAVGTAICVTTLWVMAANDYVELQGWQNSGGDLAALSSDAYGNEFMMIRVGDS